MGLQRWLIWLIMAMLTIGCSRNPERVVTQPTSQAFVSHAPVATPTAGTLVAVTQSATSIVSPAPTTATTPPFPLKPDFLPLDASVPWDAPLPALHGQTDDRDALQAALVVPEWYVQREWWLGLWPADFPILPWPNVGETWVVAVSRMQMGAQQHWQVYVEGFQSEKALRSAFEQVWKTAGWQRKSAPEIGGFFGASATAPWCHPNTPWILTLHTLPVNDTYTIATLNLDESTGGCDELMYPGKPWTLLPPLQAPDDALIQAWGGSAGPDSESQNARIRTTRSFTDIDAALRQQLDNQGWKVVWYESVVHEGEHFAASVWNQQDDRGPIVVALLLWQPKDDEEQSIYAVALAFRERIFKVPANFFEEVVMRRPQLTVVEDNPLLLKRTLALLAAFNSMWTTPEAGAAGAGLRTQVWIATRPDEWDKVAPGFPEPDAWVRVFQHRGGWQAALRWQRPADEVVDLLRKSLTDAGWLQEPDIVPSSFSGFAPPQHRMTGKHLNFCNPTTNALLWLTMGPDPDAPQSTWVKASLNHETTSPCTDEAPGSGFMPSSVETIQKVIPTLRLPETTSWYTFSKGSSFDEGRNPLFPIPSPLWRDAQPLDAEVLHFRSQMKEQGWTLQGEVTGEHLYWSQWLYIDDEGREWGLRLFIVALDDEGLYYGSLLLSGPSGSASGMP